MNQSNAFWRKRYACNILRNENVVNISARNYKQTQLIVLNFRACVKNRAEALFLFTSRKFFILIINHAYVFFMSYVHGSSAHAS